MSPRVFLYLAFAGCAQSQSVHFQWVQQVGGSQGQTIAGVATDPQGNTYVVGNTSSLDLAVKSAVQASPGGSGLVRIDGPVQWQNLYSAGFPAVNALATDPTNPQTLYACIASRLSRSTDSGASWTTVANFDATINSVAVDPSAGNILYAGTSGDGVLKSIDGGVTWTPINNGIAADSSDGKTYAFGIWIEPRNPSVVFGNTGSGVMRSSDAGATWKVTIQPGNLNSLNGLTFDSSTPGRIYVATVYAILKSTDDGVTWGALPVPAQQYPQFSPTGVLLDLQHPGTLYVSGYSGMWMSTDGGNTWALKYSNSAIALIAGMNGALYFASGNAVFVSTDGFETNTQIGPVLPGVQAIAVLGTHVFVGTQGNTDVFVTKLDAQGNTIYATYFGGAAYDQAQSMAVDSAGAVYVTGTTGSSDFPVTPGAYAKSGATFLFKLNADGSLNYSTYFAPAGSTPYAAAVDAGGNAYISGSTLGSLPVTAGAYQTSLQGSYPPCCNIGPGPPPVTNAFLTKFNASGIALIFSTYIGTQYEYATAMAVNANGEALLSGGSKLYRMSADGSALLNSTSFPGLIDAEMMDAAGNLYVGGSTSPQYGQPFPVSPGAFETAPPFASPLGYGYGFVARLDSQFNITASTLLSGESGDSTLALAATPNGNILAGGTTSSKSFPLRGAAQGSFAPSTGFVAELTPDLTSAVFSTIAGDTRTFSVRTLAPAADGGVIFAGATTPGPLYTFFGLSSELSPTGAQAFVVKGAVQPALPRIDTVVHAASLLGVALSPGETFVVRGDSFGDDATLLLNGTPVPLLAHTLTSLTAAIPLDFNPGGAVTVTVQSGGSTSNQFLAQFLPTSPGIFSVDGSGTGQAYILNADGTVNSPSNPTHPGQEITIYATGVGHMTFTQGYAVTDAQPIVTIDGFGAPGIAAVLGPVSGLPGSVYQISVYVPNPAAYASGNANLTGFTFPPTVSVTLAVGQGISQRNLTLSVGQ